MAWINCKSCGRRVSDKLDTCPKCNKNIIDKEKNIGLFLFKLLCVFMQSFLCVILISCFDLLYSEVVLDLLYIFVVCLLLFANIFIILKFFIRWSKKNVWNIILLIIVIVSFFIAIVGLVKGVNAFIYNNSKEILKLSEKYNIRDAKKIKNMIEDIFEYDYNYVSSRDIVIDSFYEDDGYHVLYLNDVDGNYHLKFKLLIEDDSIREITYNFDGINLYLVRNSQKANEFEYYYAMCIVDNLIGEDVKGVTTIEDDVEKTIKKNYNNLANSIFTYGQLYYDEDVDVFYLECDVHNMDYYANVDNVSFTILFENKFSNKKIRYYGDYSFDYVNWKIKR